MKSASVRVIFDTNVWISFLIGKRLANLKSHLSSGKIRIVTTEQLLLEIRTVTRREKIKKYFPTKSVNELIDLLETISEKVPITPRHHVSRDPKDNFLLDLIDFSEADFLVTGDKDLLEINMFQTAQILNPAEFEDQLEKMS